ncbi:hypothetical protein T484DRAFT_1818848, partial [Baffinella frigidus]
MEEPAAKAATEPANANQGPGGNAGTERVGWSDEVVLAEAKREAHVVDADTEPANADQEPGGKAGTEPVGKQEEKPARLQRTEENEGEAVPKENEEKPVQKPVPRPEDPPVSDKLVGAREEWEGGVTVDPDAEPLEERKEEGKEEATVDAEKLVDKREVVREEADAVKLAVKREE